VVDYTSDQWHTLVIVTITAAIYTSQIRGFERSAMYRSGNIAGFHKAGMQGGETTGTRASQEYSLCIYTILTVTLTKKTNGCPQVLSPSVYRPLCTGTIEGIESYPIIDRSHRIATLSQISAVCGYGRLIAGTDQKATAKGIDYQWACLKGITAGFVKV
jgi:hypothetical protein